jgi:hypothetical protein
VQELLRSRAAAGRILERLRAFERSRTAPHRRVP